MPLPISGQLNQNPQHDGLDDGDGFDNSSRFDNDSRFDNSGFVFVY